MWKPEHRLAADRSSLRYPSDLTHVEWAIVHNPTSQAWRPQAHDRCARDFEWHFLLAVDWLPMAGAAQRPAAEEHGMGLFRPLELGCHAGTHPSRALCSGTRAGGTGGKPDHGDHRQPECQGRAKRGAVLDPQGFDAGKKISGRKRHILVDTLGLLLSVAVHAATMAAIRGRRQRGRRPRPGAGRSRSLDARPPPSDSKSCPSAGSSNAPLPGSAVSGAWHVISSATPEPSPPSSVSP